MSKELKNFAALINAIAITADSFSRTECKRTRQERGTAKSNDLHTRFTDTLAEVLSTVSELSSPKHNPTVSPTGTAFDHLFWRPPGTLAIQIMAQRCRV